MAIILKNSLNNLNFLYHQTLFYPSSSDGSALFHTASLQSGGVGDQVEGAIEDSCLIHTVS